MDDRIAHYMKTVLWFLMQQVSSSSPPPKAKLILVLDSLPAGIESPSVVSPTFILSLSLESHSSSLSSGYDLSGCDVVTVCHLSPSILQLLLGGISRNLSKTFSGHISRLNILLKENLAYLMTKILWILLHIMIIKATLNYCSKLTIHHKTIFQPLCHYLQYLIIIYILEMSGRISWETAYFDHSSECVYLISFIYGYDVNTLLGVIKVCNCAVNPSGNSKI